MEIYRDSLLLDLLLCWTRFCRTAASAAVPLWLPFRVTVCDSRTVLLAPQCALPPDYLSDTPRSCDMVFRAFQSEGIGCDTPPAPARIWGVIPPVQDWYLSSTWAISRETKESMPPLRYDLAKVLRIMWGMLNITCWRVYPKHCLFFAKIVFSMHKSVHNIACAWTPETIHLPLLCGSRPTVRRMLSVAGACQLRNNIPCRKFVWQISSL